MCSRRDKPRPYLARVPLAFLDAHTRPPLNSHAFVAFAMPAIYLSDSTFFHSGPGSYAVIAAAILAVSSPRSH